MTPEILSSLGLVVPFSSRGDDGMTANWFRSHVQAASAWHTCSSYGANETAIYHIFAAMQYLLWLRFSKTPPSPAARVLRSHFWR